MSDIPVTVIGGYLGAGKTTMVNHLLRNAEERMAVLVNDFGSINIDEELISDRDGDTISLANGCICCSLADGLAAALDTVLAFDPKPERLLIEASGVADPASIAAYAHAPGLRLDAALVVVDAETIRARSTDKYVGDTVVRQLASADLLILNKVDLVDADVLSGTKAWLSRQAPKAAIVEATNGAVASAVIFDLGLVNRAVHNVSETVAEDVFQTWSWTGDELKRSHIENLMTALDERDDVFRVKGVVTLTDEPDQPMVLQRVGSRWSLTVLESEDKPTLSRVVAITAPDALKPDGLDTWLGSATSI